MIIRGMNLPLIVACVVIILALIILPLIVSYKAEKKDKSNKNEWDRIKVYGNKINNKNLTTLLLGFNSLSTSFDINTFPLNYTFEDKSFFKICSKSLNLLRS